MSGARPTSCQYLLQTTHYSLPLWNREVEIYRRFGKIVIWTNCLPVNYTLSSSSLKLCEQSTNKDNKNGIRSLSDQMIFLGNISMVSWVIPYGIVLDLNLTLLVLISWCMRPFLLGVPRNIYCFPSANTPTKMLATNLKLLFAFTTRRQQTTTCCLCTPHT